MTAIGFLLIAFGYILTRLFGCTPFEAYIGKINTADYVGGVMLAIGALLTIAGIAKWLWSFMP